MVMVMVMVMVIVIIIVITIYSFSEGRRIRPVRLLRVWVSEGLTQANS